VPIAHSSPRSFPCSSIVAMNKAILSGCLFFGLLVASPTRAQKNVTPVPEQFEIGRRTFLDFGPPFDFYEILIVRPNADGSAVERILLTPPGYQCFAHAKVESAHATINETVKALLGPKNPCAISGKELARERRRCKKCAVFSGVDVVMQVRCGEQTRLIRSAILDKDMFDPAAKTPEHTSWTMHLLALMDQAVGPGVMDKPMFSVGEPEERPVSETQSLRDVADGKYDHLFPNGPDKPSDLFRAAQVPPPVPKIRLVDSAPVAPDVFVPPAYPRIARIANVQGTVTFTVQVDPEGAASNLMLTSGHPLLQTAVQDVIASWKFPKSAAGEYVRASIEFQLNCKK
jgi:TonB family protein